MKLLSLKWSEQNDSRDRDILNQVLRAQWWINPLLNPECGRVVPAPLYPGLLAWADGTNWNPGSGEGFYRYTGSAWVFVG